MHSTVHSIQRKDNVCIEKKGILAENKVMKFWAKWLQQIEQPPTSAGPLSRCLPPLFSWESFQWSRLCTPIIQLSLAAVEKVPFAENGLDNTRNTHICRSIYSCYSAEPQKKKTLKISPHFKTQNIYPSSPPHPLINLFSKVTIPLIPPLQ